MNTNISQLKIKFTLESLMRLIVCRLRVEVDSLEENLKNYESVLNARYIILKYYIEYEEFARNVCTNTLYITNYLYIYLYQNI